MKAIFAACVARLSARRIRPGSRLPKGLRLIVFDMVEPFTLMARMHLACAESGMDSAIGRSSAGRTLNSRLSGPSNKSRCTPERP
jgi:hypothetical protein